MTGTLLIRSALDLFLRRPCPVCGQPLRCREELLCLRCEEDLPRTYYWRTVRNPMADRFNTRFSGGIAALQPEGTELPYLYAAALFFYRSEAGYAAITKALKYQARFRLGRHFAAELGRRLRESEAFRDVTAVVPVPLHPWRRFRRGYNQAAVIARAVAAELGVPVRTDLLRRRRYTRSQARLRGDSKARNVAGAFALRRKWSGGRGLPFDADAHLLLVDDVCTTGATLEACCRALLPLGIRRVSIATLAVVKD